MDTLSPVGIVHVAFGLLALVAGGLVFTVPQGTQLHRWLGYAYLVFMLALNGTAFLMYRFMGRFGPFHVLAIVSLVNVALGMAPVLRRRPGWLYRHYHWISYSYMGLWAAFMTEIAVRLPAARQSWGTFIAAISLATGVTCVVGSFLIQKNAKRLIKRVATQSRPEKLRAEEQMLA